MIERSESLRVGRRMLIWMRPYVWPWFAGALLCMVAYSATSGMVPWLVRSLIDDVLAAGDLEALAMLPPIIVAVFLARGLLNYGQSYLGEYVGQHITRDIRNLLNRRIQRLPLSYFDNAQTASLLSRVTTDVLLVRQALTDGVAALLRDSTTVIVLLGVAFYLDFELAVISFLVFPAVVVPLQRLSRRLRRLSQDSLDKLGGLSSLLQEAIQGNRVVKAFGMEDYEQQRFNEENSRLLRLYMKAARIKAITTPMMEVAAAFSIAAVLWLGGSSVIGGGRTAGGFMAFMSALALLYDPFKKVVRTNNTVQVGLGAALRIFELLDLAPEDQGDGGGEKITAIGSGVRFEGVCFSYDGRDSVLEDIDLEIGAGEMVALVGPSGGGKSTIADLIPRFYNVDRGRVTLDGRNIADLELESLRSLISVVTQSTFLFNDTLANNIAYGHPERDHGEVENAAVAANAHEFISSLPRGYDTVAGEMGVQLSGGERQRVAIARALLKDAPLLILDEATSALDTQSERLVQEALEHLVEGRTTLVIAHRLSTVRRADRIAVVSGGRIVETGTHEELLERGQLYKKLHDMQFEDRPAA